MAKSLSKTPAPKKDRIFGSDKNKKGSASSKASAKGIDLNDSIIQTLSNKAKEYNEKHPNSKVSVTTLKAVMRRGMGAYSSSHRPTITGGAPNTRQAWAYARVNAFLRKKGGQGAKPTYVQDNDLLADGGEVALLKVGQILHLRRLPMFKRSGDLGKQREVNKKVVEVISRESWIDEDEANQNNKHKTSYFFKADDNKKYSATFWGNDLISVSNDKVRYEAINNKLAHGGQLGKEITCVNCGWHWNTADSDESDKYICHKCGFDNRTFYDPEPIGVMADGGLIAPNGKPSNLTPEQYKLVRTPEFKAWFGDWENDPENASKVLDENGEPLVVYHGTRNENKEFNIFDEKFGNPNSGGGHYFSNSYDFANKFGYVREFFIKIENPLIDGFDGSGAVMYPSPYRDGGIFTKRQTDKYAEKGTKEFIVFEPNQIKLADGSNTTFDAANPDIRYANGGQTAQELFKPSKTIEQIAKEKDVPLDYAEEQLRKGIKTESEHSDNPMVQETIALQHLDEIIDYYEKLEYMESKDKMEKGGVTQFYKEYLDWYKDGVFNEMTIMVSVPNSFSKMSGGDNDVILDVFEKKDESVNAKEKMKELLEIVDRNGLDIYLEPIPRLYNIKDKAKREKITKEYLIKYYENFGFELLSNGLMVRVYTKK